MADQQTKRMRTIRFHRHGEWTDVLRLEDASVPSPGANQIRIKVHACALNPMDSVLCLGFMPGPVPGGIGLDVSGTVDALGEGVTGVMLGDLVFGVPDYMGYPSAGASEYSVLTAWAAVPEGLGLSEAAALPMAVETAVRSLDLLGLSNDQTILINGGGTMVGFAAVQIALMRGAHVIATAGQTYADQLSRMGAQVTRYGDGMADRVRELAGKAPDLILHAALVPGLLPELVKIVDGDPRRVMSITDFDDEGLGVRTTGREPDLVPRYDVLGQFAKLAAQGEFTVPIGQTFGMEEWREAMVLSHSGHAHGKVLVFPTPSN